MNAPEFGYGTERSSAPRPKEFVDYAKGLRRRAWLVVLVTLVVGAGGTAFTLRQKPVYYASTRIVIEPPRTLVKSTGANEIDGAVAASFFNTRIEMIASRRIAGRVFESLRLSDWDELHGIEDPIEELRGWLEVRPVKNSNLVDVGLQGNDPVLIAKIVNAAVDEFVRDEQASLSEFNRLGRSRIDAELRGLEGQLDTTNRSLGAFHEQHENFLLTGESVEVARLATLEEAEVEAELRLRSAERSLERLEALKESGIPILSERSQRKVDLLAEELGSYEEELAYQKEHIRPEIYEQDVAIRRMREKRDEVKRMLEHASADDAEREIERLRHEVRFATGDLIGLREETVRQRHALLGQQDERARLQSLQAEQTRLQSFKDTIAHTSLEFEVLQGAVIPRIQPIDRALAPSLPIRPIKAVQIPLCFVAGLLLGSLLAVTLEHCDRSIRVPEQVTAVTSWPILGVIPRTPRRRLVRRDGRILPVSEAPGSMLCESFRHLRIGLLGHEGSEDCRSLLVTSVLRGEGKSTVAANLAATFSRAGEAVLLVDADLRAPAVERLFGLPRGTPGLSDALIGSRTWRECLLSTDLPNLALLPAGAGGAVPLDVLGTIEMHDLLADAAERFDRVIIDAPALHERAEARILARFVDGVLFVVRSGLRTHRPLQRLRDSCVQEGIPVVGCAFNGARGNDSILGNAVLAQTTRRHHAPVATPPVATPRPSAA